MPASAQALASPATRVPTADLGPLTVSRIIKGCWQLSGGHRGDPATDRTAGQAAVDDLRAFADVGVTTLDTADHYGPSEELIGRYIKQYGAQSSPVVLTKACFFAADQYAAKSMDPVKQRVAQSASRLGLATLPMVQFYWYEGYGGA